ncbi:MAG: nitrate reductase cytochrome c-type subunit [Burkholderiales bacterium]|nr:nitrate reductase cytochrome c-type subunit [Burkholderiales bacterium]
MMRAAALILLAAFAAAGTLAYAQQEDRMRGTVPVADETRPPPLRNPENKDVRRERAYSMQPPTIPHKIDGYQVDLNVNACLGCHSRGRAPVTQAVAVSVSHYMDRDGNFLAEISPRRYFCEQCHVPQDEVKPLVGNRFVDVDEILRGAPGAPAATRK